MTLPRPQYSVGPTANLLNSASVLTLQRRDGPTYLDALQIMGGRLLKVGVQFDF